MTVRRSLLYGEKRPTIPRQTDHLSGEAILDAASLGKSYSGRTTELSLDGILNYEK